MKAPKIPSSTLRDCALEQMKKNGTPLKAVHSGSRAMLYEMPDGRSVRIRTSNDPILVVAAESSEMDARLNIEGTDLLLITMPEKPRTPGPVKSFLVPADIAVNAVRDSHKKWLSTNPNTKGDNRTWNLWFDNTGRPSGGYAEKWSTYLLSESADSLSEETLTDTLAPSTLSIPGATPRKETVADVIEGARQKISNLTGMPLDSIQIDIKLGA